MLADYNRPNPRPHSQIGLPLERKVPVWKEQRGSDTQNGRNSHARRTQRRMMMLALVRLDLLVLFCEQTTRNDAPLLSLMTLGLIAEDSLLTSKR